jgi:parvulin-like peptidyl-prolyl isomerase
MHWKHWKISTTRLEQLLRRKQLIRSLLRHELEEEVVAIVALSAEESNSLLQTFLENNQIEKDVDLKAWLDERGWTQDDLLAHVSHATALNRFATQRFGPGIEETFINRKRDLDTVVYSLLRVQDEGLARELWIQLSEGEISFPEAAGRFSDGPEAGTKGVIGPMPLGQLQPELADRLRSLQCDELREPLQAGPWWILLRLEQLTPAKLDEAMRQRLLDEQLNQWLDQRCDAVLRGESVEPLHYDSLP